MISGKFETSVFYHFFRQIFFLFIEYDSHFHGCEIQVIQDFREENIQSFSVLDSTIQHDQYQKLLQMKQTLDAERKYE